MKARDKDELITSITSLGLGAPKTKQKKKKTNRGGECKEKEVAGNEKKSRSTRVMGRRSETVLQLQIFFDVCCSYRCRCGYVRHACVWHVHQSSHNNERKGPACSDVGRYEGCVDSPMTPIAVRMISFETMVGGASERALLCFGRRIGEIAGRRLPKLS